jgi:hypothetical protein
MPSCKITTAKLLVRKHVPVITYWETPIKVAGITVAVKGNNIRLAGAIYTRVELPLAWTRHGLLSPIMFASDMNSRKPSLFPAWALLEACPDLSILRCLGGPVCCATWSAGNSGRPFWTRHSLMQWRRARFGNTTWKQHKQDVHHMLCKKAALAGCTSHAVQESRDITTFTTTNKHNIGASAHHCSPAMHIHT